MKYFILMTSLIFSVAFTRDTVGNGQGKSEKTIVYVYSKLETYISLCFQTDNCYLNQKEYGILAKILNSLSEERFNAEQLKFVSEKENPGFFYEDGHVRAAKTGSRVGSTIYINREMIYTKNSQGFEEAITLSQAAVMLIHELGHHQGDYTHDELDTLGTKVAGVLDLQIFSTPVIPWSNSVSAEVINSKTLKTKTSLLLFVFDELSDLSSTLQDVSLCPDQSTSLGVMLYNLHWLSYPRTGDGTRTYSFRANSVLACKTDSSIAQVTSPQVTVTFNVANKVMVPGSLKLVQE